MFTTIDRTCRLHLRASVPSCRFSLSGLLVESGVDERMGCVRAFLLIEYQLWRNRYMRKTTLTVRVLHALEPLQWRASFSNVYYEV